MDSEIELHLDAMAFGGEAVGRDDEGRVVFVAGGAPGDRVVARVVERKRSFARAQLVRVLSPGARVTPPCSLVDRCGGCPWQHLPLATQAEAKQAIVAHALRRLGGTLHPLLAAPTPLGYRTRARMTARGGVLGFFGRRSHEIVEVETCLALDPALDRALQAARGALAPLLGEEGSLAGLVQPDGVALALGAGRGADRRRLAQVGAALVGQAGIVGVTLDDPEAPAAGFAQANQAQNEVLRGLVRQAAQSAPRLLELYAGDGNFTRDLVAQTDSGVAVESDRHAAARLGRLLAGRPFSVRAEPAERAVAALRRAQERFDLVVLDPPRAGAAEVMEALPALLPERIVYISCDPSTLARDLGLLTPHGYAVREVWPVDMMPQTWHVEVVCLVERAPAAGGPASPSRA